MAKYLETKAEFDQALKDAGDKLVVVDFTVAWSGACNSIAPKFNMFSEEFSKHGIFYFVDTDKNSETAGAQNIFNLPTFIAYKNGMKLDQVNEANECSLRGMIKKYI